MQVWRRSYEKWRCYPPDNTFSFISLWENFSAFSEVNSPSWPEFELIQDFMPVHVVCKSHKDLIKTKQAKLQTRLNTVFLALKGK